MFRLQVQDDDSDPASWHDVKGGDGKLLLFAEERDARAKLQELFPVLVGLEKFAAGHKRTRVLRVYDPDQDEDK